MPELQTLNCGNCGAPLEIPTSVNYVTCRFCHSQLHVQRTESVVFTEVIQSLQQETSRLSEATEVLKLKHSLLELEQNWEQKLHSLAVQGKPAFIQRPNRNLAILLGILITIAGIFLFAFGVLVNPFFILAALLGTPLVISLIVREFQNRNELAEDAVHFQQRRQELLDKIAQRERTGCISCD